MHKHRIDAILEKIPSPFAERLTQEIELIAWTGKIGPFKDALHTEVNKFGSL